MKKRILAMVSVLILMLTIPGSRQDLCAKLFAGSG